MIDIDEMNITVVSLSESLFDIMLIVLFYSLCEIDSKFYAFKLLPVNFSLLNFTRFCSLILARCRLGKVCTSESQ